MVGLAVYLNFEAANEKRENQSLATESLILGGEMNIFRGRR